jgi:uncharacterized membrane protein YcaP (DUF421 family)
MALFFSSSRKTVMDLTQIWGNKAEIGLVECAARAAVMFILMVVMLRLSGMRSFGKGDVFDNILTILLGAVLARGIVGATPFLSAIAGGVTIMVIHNVLSNLSFYHHWIGKIVKGRSLLLYSKGEYNPRNMSLANITENDIKEQLRISLHANSLDEVEEIYFERTGKVSFVKKSNSSN